MVSRGNRTTLGKSALQLAYFGVLALALSLPFGTSVGVSFDFSGSSYSFPLAQCLIYLSVALWVVAFVVGEADALTLPRPSLAVPLLLLGAHILLAALWTEYSRFSSMSEAGRVVSGMGLVLVVPAVLRTEQRREGLLTAILCMGAAAAVMGWLGILDPNRFANLLGEAWYLPEHSEELALTSFFQTPEEGGAIFAICLVLASYWFLSASMLSGVLGSSLLVILLATALCRTLHASSWLGGVFAVGALTVLTWDVPVKRRVSLVVIVLGVFSAMMMASPKEYKETLRPSTSSQVSGYLEVSSDPVRFWSDKPFYLGFRVHNDGHIPWRPPIGPRMDVGYRWIRTMDSGLAGEDKLAHRLPALMSEETLRSVVRVDPPDAPGSYVLALDLVQNESAWLVRSLARVVILDCTIPDLPTRISTCVWTEDPELTKRAVGTAGPRLSNFDRVLLWRTAMALAREYPVFGVGPGGLNEVLGGSLTESPNHRGSRDAHSLYLHVAAEYGFVGIFLFLIFYGAIVWTLQNSVRVFQTRAGQLQAAMISGVVVGLLAHGILAYVFNEQSVLTLTWLLAGFAVSLSVDSNPALSERASFPAVGSQ